MNFFGLTKGEREVDRLCWMWADILSFMRIFVYRQASRVDTNWSFFWVSFGDALCI